MYKQTKKTETEQNGKNKKKFVKKEINLRFFPDSTQADAQQKTKRNKKTRRL